MSRSGLMSICSELVDLLDRSTEDERYRIVERACLLAIRRSGVSDPRLVDALDAIRRRDFTPPHLCVQVDTLTQELDEAAWGVQDRIETGDATEVEYHQHFAKARAVAAVGFALDGSATASFESLYEAYYAIGEKCSSFRAMLDLG